jgi:hypothetical protein
LIHEKATMGIQARTYTPGATERRAMAYSIEPIAIYAVDEQMNKRGRSTFHASLLSEVGWHSCDRSFWTMEEAQSVCQSNVDQWREQIKATA